MIRSPVAHYPRSQQCLLSLYELCHCALAPMHKASFQAFVWDGYPVSLRVAIFDYINLSVPVLLLYRCLLRYLEHIHQFFFVCLAFSVLFFAFCGSEMRRRDACVLCVTLCNQILNILLSLAKHHLNDSRLICLGILDWAMWS